VKTINENKKTSREMSQLLNACQGCLSKNQSKHSST